MKLGIVLPSYMYNKDREKLADATFNSLAQTEPLLNDTMLLFVVKSGLVGRYLPYAQELRKKFRVVLHTDENINGTEQTLAFGTRYLIDEFAIDTITWMGDDALFHPMWLWKLEDLIRAKPDAKAWNVYRSAFEWVHRTLKEDGDYIMARSVCGHGMTFTAKEWNEWGITTDAAGKYGVDGSYTLDVEHTEQRPGERWVTKQSYVEHTGKEGVHCTTSIPEYARDFVEVA